MTGLFWVSYGALWFVVAILFVAVFVMFRHTGQMLLNTRDARANQGPGNGARFPTKRFPEPGGGDWELPDANVPYHLILLAVRDCRLCERVIPPLCAVAAEMRGDLQVWFVYQGSGPDLQRIQTQLSSEVRVVQDRKSSLMRELRVTHTPYAFLVAADGVILRSMLVNDRRQIDWLVEPIQRPQVGVLGEATA